MDDDDDDDDDVNWMECIAQSYATREYRTNAGTRKTKDGGGQNLAVSVDRDVENISHPRAHRIDVQRWVDEKH